MRRVALVGNGLSIAANAGFALGPLTTAVQVRLETVQIGARTAREHLEQIRDRLEADGHQDPNASTFERLLGPLDRLRGLINVELPILVGALQPELAEPLTEVGVLVHELYVRGVGAVLSEIDSLDTHANLDHARQLVRWATADLGNYDYLSVYTINYDPLVDRVLLELETDVVSNVVVSRYVLADEYSGLPVDASWVSVAPGIPAVRILSQRSEPYGRLRAVDLIHLHGGQHWIRSSNGLVYKAPVPWLRGIDAYGRWMRGDPMHFQPAVVLTDQKSSAVLQDPFVRAYGRLRHDLAQSDRVAIVGYGFGDQPLNAALREGLAVSKQRGSKWVINRNTCAVAEEAHARAQMGQVLGLADEDLPDVLFRSLPAIAVDRADFFKP
jgi:hypothetical protein